MKQTFVALLCLAVAIAMIPVVINARGYYWTVLYGTFAFMGWITGIILGKTFKTLPFIVWNGHYKSLSGKVKVPLPKHLYSELLVKWQFRIFIIALLFLAAAILMNNVVVFRIASGLWLILSTLYLVNVMKVLLHKTKILS